MIGSYRFGYGNIPAPEASFRSVSFEVTKAGSFTFVTADGFEVTLRLNLNAVRDPGQRNADGIPNYQIDFVVTPTTRRVLDQLDLSKEPN